MNDLQQCIKALKNSGLTESQISEGVKSSAVGVGCTQATINRIYTGGIKNPNYRLAQGILSFHESHISSSKPSQ